jgi:hypothetical protein
MSDDFVKDLVPIARLLDTAAPQGRADHRIDIMESLAAAKVYREPRFSL